MEKTENKEPTAREVLIECREAISKLRHENRKLIQQNKMLLREKEMMLSLFERGGIESTSMSSPDPLFTRIQRQIELLYED